MPLKLPRLPIADQIWESKYRYSGQNYVIELDRQLGPDRSIQDTWRRIAFALSTVEKDQQGWENKFYSALEDFKFIPAGRIVAGSGTGRNVTLHNCFVMDTIGDSVEDIFRNLGEAAKTMQMGGGIGYDFSTIRPRGAKVRGVDADASGPLSYMDVWDSMCKTIMSAGSRRGAMMATLRCDHPDIEAFILAKREPGRLTNFNLSVLVTDSFMDAVKNDDDWDLQFAGQVYRTVRAVDLWNLITKTTYEVAEPGVIFIDRINARNNLYYVEQIAATNPCGEQPLPPYGTCLLGSLNLAALVSAPFTGKADLDRAFMQETIYLAVRMMDNVVEASKYPVPRQQEEAESKRRIGLGITGLADALAMCGLTYGSPEAVRKTREWMRDFQTFAYGASVELAQEKGPFPLFDAKRYCAGETISKLPHELYQRIAKYGIRNALVTSIAPTGTISLFADNISSGVEPIFALEYTRKTLQPDGSKKEETVSDWAVRAWHQLHFGKPLPAQFVTSQDLKVEAHLAMQAAVQDYVDSSISKTINVPESYPFEDFQQIYLRAYDLGCKGCTTYRPSSVRGSVLEVPGQKKEEKKPGLVRGPGEIPLRPDELSGVTSKLKWGDDPAYFLTVNVLDGVPFEIFINSKATQHSQWIAAVSRLVTAIFRRGGDIAFLADELIQVTDPNGGAWIKGKFVPSLVALIGMKLRDHLGKLGIVSQAPVSEPEPEPAQPQPPLTGEPCPKCSAPGLQRKEGCKTCLSCGFSSCS